MDKQADALISLEGVSFAYWSEESDKPERPVENLKVVFEGLSMEIPKGVSSVLGENGIGKTTLLLLAGARIFPAEGRVLIEGRDSRDFRGESPEAEEARNRYISFVYQNMEFETEENLGTLLENIAGDSGTAARHPGLPGELEKEFELTDVLGRRPQELSKGELQRAVLAMALCYGSPILIMDEPVFALEEAQKARAFAFLSRFCRESGTHLVYTAHDIELCTDYADTMILLEKGGVFQIGKPSDLGTRENLERAYRVPFQTLKQKQDLYRSMLRTRFGA